MKIKLDPNRGLNASYVYPQKAKDITESFKQHGKKLKSLGLCGFIFTLQERDEVINNLPDVFEDFWNVPQEQTTTQEQTTVQAQVNENQPPSSENKKTSVLGLVTEDGTVFQSTYTVAITKEKDTNEEVTNLMYKIIADEFELTDSELQKAKEDYNLLYPNIDEEYFHVLMKSLDKTQKLGLEGFVSSKMNIVLQIHKEYETFNHDFTLFLWNKPELWDSFCVLNKDLRPRPFLRENISLYLKDRKKEKTSTAEKILSVFATKTLMDEKVTPFCSFAQEIDAVQSAKSIQEQPYIPGSFYFNIPEENNINLDNTQDILVYLQEKYPEDRNLAKLSQHVDLIQRLKKQFNEINLEYFKTRSRILEKLHKNLGDEDMRLLDLF